MQEHENFEAMLAALEEDVASEGPTVTLGSYTVEEGEPVSDFPFAMDRFDHALAEEMRDESDTWQNIETRREGEFEGGFEDVMKTWFGGLWKPYTEEKENLSKRGSKLKKILETARSLPEWAQLRESTRLDEVASALATVAMGNLVEVPDPEDVRDGDGDGEEGDGEPQEGPYTDSYTRQQVRKALQDAQQDVEDYEDMQSFLWGDESMDPHRVAPQKRLRLARQIKQHPRLKQIAKLVGRLQIVAAQTHKRRVNRGRDELADVVMGDDLRDVLPEELAFLASRKTRTLFLKKFVDRELLQYQFEGKEQQGRGPIVVRIDTSGSMNSRMNDGSSYMEWAIAIGLALAVIAKKEKRNLNIGFFNTKVLERYTFPKGQYGPEAAIQLASIGVGGGTAFEPPLRDGMDQLEESDFKNGDFIFITDDACSVTDTFEHEFKEAKSRKDWKMVGIQVGHARTDPVLARLADETFVLDENGMTGQIEQSVFSI